MNNQIIRTTPTADNPDGIVSVPESIAIDVGRGANLGGGGAAGTTVAGPVTDFLTKNGKLPLSSAGSQFSIRFRSTMDGPGVGRNGMVVTGGTRDGVYVDLDPVLGEGVRGFFELSGGPGTAVIKWQSDEVSWKIFDLVGGPNLLYYAFSDVARPDLVPNGNTPDGWKNADDTPASITVTSERYHREDRAATCILLETIGATHKNPYFVEFNQIILEPFTGEGEFYLDESDVGDAGGESTITVATKDGFSAGFTPGIVRANTVDKIYRVTFTPGTTGDGMYWINIFVSQQEYSSIGIRSGLLPRIPPSS